MKTLYIDVFFFINFTIDILAAFFSSGLCHIKTNVKRLIFCGVLGALVAILDVLIELPIVFRLLVSLLYLLIISFLIADISLIRRCRFLIGFVVCQIVIGGIVSFAYSQLLVLYEKYGSDIIGGAENRRLIIISLIILLSIGVLKMFLLFYSHAESNSSVRIGIKLGEVYVEEDAMLDTGNLVKDPMNMCPVLFVKEELAKRFLPSNVIELSGIDTLDAKYRKRIRLIPVTRGNATHVLTGVRVDKVGVVFNGRLEEVSMTVAIDKEGGTFGGYMALAPYVLSQYADKSDKKN